MSQHKKQEKFTHIITEFIRGLDALEHLSPCVSIFGSSRISEKSTYAQIAMLLAKQLSNLNISIITGGGPGIMSAANQGAKEGPGGSIGLNMELPLRTEPPNRFTTLSLKFRYFFTRKATFFAHSCAYIIFPGGYGTLDEATEVLTMIQANKLHKAPVIFVGVEFWQGFLSWLQDKPLKEGMITQEHFALFTVTDNLDEIISIIQKVTQGLKEDGRGYNTDKNFYFDL